jgi:hypothetical protein
MKANELLMLFTKHLPSLLPSDLTLEEGILSMRSQGETKRAMGLLLRLFENLQQVFRAVYTLNSEMSA